MTGKFARILLATLIGVALGGVAACDQPGSTEQAEAELGETIDQATGDVAPPPEAAEEEEESE
jgi:hypothetical protein